MRDGMDVINMSFGESETDPARNVVDQAVDGAAAAGVVPVAAAGNSFGDLGRGSIGSPATASRAITVAAVTKSNVLAGFSSSGPTALSLRMKPEVSAPGASILSSVPERDGTWASFSGTSMASPHVAGAVALLLQQHPAWTVDQVTSALVQTGRPVLDAETEEETLTTREGGGLVNLPAADNPLVFVKPSVVSLGLLRVGTTRRVPVDVTDAGGGAGSWNVSLRLQASPGGVKLSVPSTVSVPGRLEVVAEVGADGYRTRSDRLRRPPARQRHAAHSVLAEDDAREAGPTGAGADEAGSLRRKHPKRKGERHVVPLSGRSGRHRSDELVPGAGAGRSACASDGAVANVGVRITRQPKGVSVTPRIVYAGDENRLGGVPSLPIDVNPLPRTRTASCARLSRQTGPRRGLRPRLRYPLAIRCRAFLVPAMDRRQDTSARQALTPTAEGPVVLSVADGGSGIDPRSVIVAIDGQRIVFKLSSTRLRVPLEGISPGKHVLLVSVADFQETKNSESVVGVLPNTTTLRKTITVR